MSHQNELFDLRNHSGSDSDNDWIPFERDLPPPDDIEDLPPSDSEPPEDDPESRRRDEQQEQKYNEVPEIDEPPPPVEKKTKGPSKKEERVQQREESHVYDAIDRALGLNMNDPFGSHEYEYAPPKGKKKAAPVGKAAKKKKQTGPIDPLEIEKHQGLLLQIDRYRLSKRFEEALHASGLRLTGIEDYDVEQLQELVTRIRTVVGSRSGAGGSLMGAGILIGTGIVERHELTNQYVNIQGLSQALSQNQEFLDIVEQLSIDYSFMSTLSPEKRLAIVMFKMGAQMNAINAMRANAGGQQAPRPMEVVPPHALRREAAEMPPDAPKDIVRDPFAPPPAMSAVVENY
jgi:hypothetical protein